MKNLPQYTKKVYRKKSEENTITCRDVYMFLTNKNKPIFDKDGFLYIFYREKDAESVFEKIKIKNSKIKRVRLWITM